jgi:hypothetical protein
VLIKGDIRRHHVHGVGRLLAREASGGNQTRKVTFIRFIVESLRHIMQLDEIGAAPLANLGAREEDDPLAR